MLAEQERHAARPQPVPAQVRRRTRSPALLGGAVLLVLAIVLPLLRQTGVHSWDTIWGEDGWVYFQQAHDHGFLSVLLRGYAGYLQLPPRLLALGAVLVPTRDLSLYLAVAGAVVGAALAWFVYWAAEGWVDSRAARVALASMVVLMPALGWENTANITNTIWIFFAVAPWALVARGNTRGAVVVRGAVAFASATATALTAVFLPLAVAVGLRRRRRPDWIVVASFCGGLVLQFAVVTHTRDTRPHTTVRQVASLPQAIGIRVFALFLLGQRGIEALWSHRGTLAVVVPLVVLGLLVVLGRDLDRRRQLLAAVFVAFAFLTFLVPVWGRGTNHVGLLLTANSILGPGHAGQYDPMSTRYSVVPILLLAGAAAIVLGASRPTRPSLTRALRTSFVAWVVVVTAVGFSVTNPRSLGPQWSTSVVTSYHAHCVGAAPGGHFAVPVPNHSVNPAVVLSCRDRP